MKMYIIRHGQTPWNARKCLQGRSDVDLNENGIYLAELTGKALRCQGRYGRWRHLCYGSGALLPV